MRETSPIKFITRGVLMTITKSYAVSAIRNGTVIDHIEAGHALKIVKFLRLADHRSQVTLGLNLPSQVMGYKDLIKVEEKELAPEELNQIAILAPDATISIIKEYVVNHKYKLTLPEKIFGMIECSNPRCISNHEKILSQFHVLPKRSLKCHYCRKTQGEIR